MEMEKFLEKVCNKPLAEVTAILNSAMTSMR